jgi:hypothetical protein
MFSGIYVMYIQDESNFNNIRNIYINGADERENCAITLDSH